jgi:hypothetical protein
MKSIIYLILLTSICGMSAFAQKAKPRTAALPAAIAQWAGQDSDIILNDPAIKTRLQTLLGTKNYASFVESFETVTPITKDGHVLFSSGCLIHACTHLESAIAIDLKANTIHAAIFNDVRKTRFYNERGSKTPDAVAKWAKRLNDLKGGQDRSRTQ